MTKKLWIAGGLLIFAGVCPAAENVNQEVTIGFNYKEVSEKEAKFDEYRNIPRGLFIESYRLGIDQPGYGLNFSAKNMLRDDQFTEMLYKRESGLTFRAWWDKTPHRLSFFSRTPYSTDGLGTFTLSDEIQSNIAGASGATRTAKLLALGDNTNYSPLQLLRESYGIDLAMPLNPAWEVRVGAKQEHKFGTKAISGSLGHSLPVELPEPVDYLATDLNVGATFKKPTWHVSMDYGVSLFENRFEYFTWDAPAAITATTTTANRGRTSLYPNNTQHHVTLAAGAELPLQSQLNVSLGWALGLQNQKFLPYTLNTAMAAGAGPVNINAYDPASLPASSMDGKVQSLVQSWTLTGRPLVSRPLGVRLHYGSNEIENNSREITFPATIRYDSSWSARAVTNKLFDTRRRNLDADLSYEILPKLDAGAGYGFEWIDRTHREVEKTQELVWRGSLAYKPFAYLGLRADYLSGQRRMKDFNIDDYKNTSGTFFELPGLRRSDVANRDHERVSTNIQMAPAQDIWIQISGFYETEDFRPGKGDLTGGVADYINSMYGLLRTMRRGGTFSTDWPVSASADVALLYDIQQIEFESRSNYTGTSNVTQNELEDWLAINKDLYHTVGMESSYRPAERLGLSLGYNYSIGKGKIHVTDIPATATVEKDPPDTKSEIHEVSLGSQYEIGEGLALVAGYTLTIFDVEDFLMGDVPIIAGKTAAGAASPNAIYLGDNLRDYTANVAFVGLKYKW